MTKSNGNNVAEPTMGKFGSTYGGRRPSAKSLGRKIRSGTGIPGTKKRSASSKSN